MVDTVTEGTEEGDLSGWWPWPRQDQLTVVLMAGTGSKG